MNEIDHQEMSESATSKIDSENIKTSSETDTESEDSEKHDGSSSSDDIDQESPVIIDSGEETEEENEEEPSEVYLVYVDGYIKGYHDTEESAQNYIEKLARDYKRNYVSLYPGWTAWTMYLREFYSEVRIMTRYNFYIINYDRVEHTFRYQAVSKLPFL